MPFIESNGRKICFVHIPKTGGTSIEHWMSNYGTVQLRAPSIPPAMKITPQHLTYSDLRALFAEDFFDFTFSIIRNPFDRIASDYRMRHLIAQQQNFFGEFTPFPQWLSQTLQQYRNNPFLLDNHIRPQWQFLSKHVTVFRYEDGLAPVREAVMTAAGWTEEFELPREASSKEFDGTIEWDTAEIGLVQEVYAKDFEMFDYPTDPPAA